VIECARFLGALRERGVRFYAGVPDSLLKEFCACIADRADPGAHVISANEGGAVALAAGHHLATGGTGLVYLQNSGFGNLVNPLLSLADPGVYGIPLILLIGWRGEPGTRDEPQHVRQGTLTLPLLDALGIPWRVLPQEEAGAGAAVADASRIARERSGPFALVVRAKTFAPYTARDRTGEPHPMTREEALRAVTRALPDDDVVVATTGKTSRELFELRVEQGRPPGRDFLTVGSMGHVSQIALGVALARPRRRIVCIDGDGSVLMHMGSLVTVGRLRPANFRHVVLNNGAHDSVGGQPTGALDIDLPAVATACGYRYATATEVPERLAAEVGRLVGEPGPAFLEVRIRRGAREGLGRPTTTPAEAKAAFMRFLAE
jgi:phosphonopyruvate decarboxylase